MKIQIEESALETMKIMVQWLQDERDMLLNVLIFSRTAMRDASNVSMQAARELADAIEQSRAAIAACTDGTKVIEP